MENIIKNIHKIESFLGEEKSYQIEQFALMYRRYARIGFKVMAFDETEKKLIVKVRQEKKPDNENYRTEKELHEKGKELFSKFFDGFTIHVDAKPYTETSAEIITPEYLKAELNKRQIRIKDINTATGLEMSNLSAWVNGTRPMSNIVKNMFYYYLKSLDK